MTASKLSQNIYLSPFLEQWIWGRGNNFFSYAKDNLQKQWEENVIHIGEYFKKDMCLHCHCTALVAGGSNNPGQITQRSSRLPRKGSSLCKTHSATSALKWSLVRCAKRLIILVNSRHVRRDSDTAAITWGMWQHFYVVVFVYLVYTPENALKLGAGDLQQ